VLAVHAPLEVEFSLSIPAELDLSFADNLRNASINLLRFEYHRLENTGGEIMSIDICTRI